MKIAFTSSMLQQRFDSQPVWQRIQALDPDHLVLLGNTIHLDIDAAPRQMTDDEFGVHGHALYRAQLAVPEFDALLRHMAGKGGRRVFAVWDDHDLLWRDAAGADIASQPELEGKVARSKALLLAFRQALAEVGSFTDSFDDIHPPPDDPLHESLPLRDDVWLHLTDGRSHRTGTWLVPHDKRALVGQPQLEAIAASVTAAEAQAVHLLASASTSSRWKDHPLDWRALNALAGQHRMLMLSGDGHCNAFASHAEAQGLALHEATASGAAVRDAVVYGADLENFAIADIQPAAVHIRFFDRHGETASRHIRREDWHIKTGA